MKAFMDQDFMLLNDTARKLYHEHAETLPIIDYHCHLSAKEICENKPAHNLTELWLLGDHYKWRGMRANGIPEKRITGDAEDYDKFLALRKHCLMRWETRCITGRISNCSGILMYMRC